MRTYVHATALTKKNQFKNHLSQIPETPLTLQNMDNNRGFPNIITISYELYIDTIIISYLDRITHLADTNLP